MSTPEPLLGASLLAGLKGLRRKVLENHRYVSWVGGRRCQVLAVSKSNVDDDTACSFLSAMSALVRDLGIKVSSFLGQQALLQLPQIENLSIIRQLCDTVFDAYKFGGLILYKNKEISAK